MDKSKIKDLFKPIGSNRQYLDDEKITVPSLTFFHEAWIHLKHNKSAMVSLWILIILFILAFGSLLWSPSNPDVTHPAFTNLPPKIPGVPIPGLNGTLVEGGQRINAYAKAGLGSHVFFLCGTDDLGRDLFSRMLYGTRISLTIAVIATLLDLTIGVTYGLISGWKGGKVDNIMQRFIEIMLSLPDLVIMILLILIMKPGITAIILAISLSSWIGMARLIRGQTLSIKNNEYVIAARALGEKPFKIALKHLLPNLSSVIIINTMFTAPSAIFFEAFLSYIGIGIRAPQASLGTLISNGQSNFEFLPYQMWCPAIILVLIMIAFNLLGDGLRDAFDPRAKR